MMDRLTADSMKKRIREASDTRSLQDALDDVFDAMVDAERLNNRMQPEEVKRLERAASKGPRNRAARK